MMLSISELKNIEAQQETVTAIESTKNEIRKYFNSPKLLHLDNDESFAFLKKELLNLFIETQKNYPTSINEVIELKNKLTYNKVIIKPQDNHFYKIYDDYNLTETTSFLKYTDEIFNYFFERSKEIFKEELLRTDREYDYFDTVLEYLLEDYQELLKRLQKEKTYFIPVIKLFRNYYLSLFRHIFTEYTFYLKKEHRIIIDKMINQREYIKTLKIEAERYHIGNNNRKIEAFCKELIAKNYISEYDNKRIINFFTGKRHIDGLINWQQKIGTLHTLIRMLFDKNFIRETEYWKITSRYFTVQQKTINVRQLRDSKFSTKKETVQELKSIISKLEN